MKAIQIDYVRKMLARALDKEEFPQTPDDIISSFPGAVEDMELSSRYNYLSSQNKLNEEKVSLLLDVIKELG